MSESVTFPEIFARIEAGTFGAEDVGAAFGAILAGAWTPVQIGAFAAALRLRGESAEALVAAAHALRAVMSRVEHDHAVVVDTCGTGGDGAHTINVSTAAAVALAAAGCVVAKHGNRSVSSRCGSADVVDALGVPIDVAPERQSAILRDAGIAFLMAPVHHPALRHAASARRELGIRTLFNALGPLVNPARASHQLVGVYDDRLRAIAASALARLGLVRAWVVRSEDGLDEISPAGPTRVTVLDGGRIEERVVCPEDFGLAPVALDALRGGDAAHNAAIIVRLFDGEDHPAKTAVIVNAAAALVVARGDQLSLRDAANEIADILASGTAKRTLERWRVAARGAKA